MSELRLRIVLNSHESKRVRTTLAAGFNAKGDLVLEGFDSGSSVEEMWGSDDYEYWLTVEQARLPELALKLAEAIGQENAGGSLESNLLALLGKVFTEGHARLYFENDSQFQKWMEKAGIPSSFSSFP
jgi:hypothetical protein